MPTKKKSEGKDPETKIKYTDKSPAQPELIPIFNNIRDMLLSYEKGHLKMRGGKNGQAILVSEKPVVIDGRKKDELWFAGVLIQKGYVGFYYMPIYANQKLRDVFKPELLKCLKGKSCFHIKKNDPLIMDQIKESLKVGYNFYKDYGWI